MQCALELKYLQMWICRHFLCIRSFSHVIKVAMKIAFISSLALQFREWDVRCAKKMKSDFEMNIFPSLNSRAVAYFWSENMSLFGCKIHFDTNQIVMQAESACHSRQQAGRTWMNLVSEDLQSYVQLCHSVEPRCQSPGTFTSHLFSIKFFWFHSHVQI